jgi:hypothetical protein
MPKQTMKTNAPPSLAVFDGPADAPWQCRVHRPMKEVQGFGRSHWILTIGQVSAVYCPSSHRDHMQNNNDKKHTYFASHSDGHGNKLLHALLDREDSEIQQKPLDAPIRQVFAPIISIRHSYIIFMCFFMVNLFKKGLGLRQGPY